MANSTANAAATPAIMIAAASWVGAEAMASAASPAAATSAPISSGPKRTRPLSSWRNRAAGGGQEAEQHRLGERPRIDGEERRRRQVALDHLAQQDRRGGADREADGDAQRRQQGDLDQVEVAHQRPVGAHRLQRGDRGLARLQVGPDRAGDAEAAGDQRREADEAEEVFQLVDQPAETRRGLGAVAHPVAALRQRPGERRLRRREADAGLQRDARRLAERQAGAEEAAAAHHREPRQHAWPEVEAAREPVGLAEQHGAGDHRHVADQEPVAELEAEPVEERLLDRHAGGVPDGLQRIGEPRVAAQRHLADQRVARRDPAQLHQPPLARRRLRHRPAGGGVGDAAQPRHRRLLGRGELALLQPDREVAAEDLGRLRGQPDAKRLRRRPRRRDRRHAQRQAGQKNAKAPHPGPQLAGREAQRKRQPHPSPLAGEGVGGADR
jgi:hypothetical protein